MQSSSNSAQIFFQKAQSSLFKGKEMALDVLTQMDYRSQPRIPRNNIQISSSKSSSRTLTAGGYSEEIPSYNMQISGSSSDDDLIYSAQKHLEMDTGVVQKTVTSVVEKPVLEEAVAVIKPIEEPIVIE